MHSFNSCLMHCVFSTKERHPHLTAAVRELQTCLQTQWYRAESWELLGQLLTRIGMPNEAAVAHRQASAYDVHLGGHAGLL